MSCTTILVGKNASYDGSTLIARNDDSGADGFTAKKFVVIEPHQQQRKYKTVLSNLEIDLPDNPLKYTAMPNAVKGKGIWAASGINEENIAMTATETITSNPRVLMVQIHLSNMMKKMIFQEALVKKTLSILSYLIFIVLVKV